MKRKRNIGFLIVVLSLSLSLASAEGQGRKDTAKPDDKMPKGVTGFGFTANRGPINIQSDTVEASQKENAVVFKGNVIATQEDATLYATQVVIHYNAETKKVKEIVASGGVKVVQLDRRATGKKVIFDQDGNKVILEGDAVIREGDNVIRGERVIYFMNEERSIVEGGKGGRVTTTISPSKKD